MRLSSGVPLHQIPLANSGPTDLKATAGRCAAVSVPVVIAEDGAYFNEKPSGVDIRFIDTKKATRQQR